MTPKTPGSDSSKKKTPKSKSTSKKPNAKGAGSEDEVAPKPQEEVLSPTQLREKKEKEGESQLQVLGFVSHISSPLHPS
jgi:hypothetical protein